MISAIARQEHIADITATYNTSANLPTQGGQLPMDRFLYGLLLEFEGRFTNPAGPNNPTGFQADAPFSIIERVSVEGFHRVRKQQERFVDLRGPDLRELVSQYQGLDCFTTHTAATLSLAAAGTNDVRFIIPVPFVPLQIPSRGSIGYLLDAPNYDALKLTIQFGDALSLFTGGTPAAITLTAFGSAAGSARVRVAGQFAIAGASQFAGFVPGRVWRSFQEVTGSDMTTTATGKRLLNVPRGHKIRSMLLKTGVKSAAVTAGNNAFNTLSNTILANLKLFRGTNKLIRSYIDQIVAREDGALIYNRRNSDGYALIDFSQRGIDESFDTRGLIAGATGDVDVYLEADVTGVAAQALVCVYEEWRGQPTSFVAR